MTDRVLRALEPCRVTLSIDGATRTVACDVRESLWETMVYRLGLAGANMGCDRAACGACHVLIDGRSVQSCVVLTARLGRGERIVTVDGLRRGPGLAGLHPLQRAFWERGAVQCGACTKGFIVSAYALLGRNADPTEEEIRRALAGVLCRCGEYSRAVDAVKWAAAEMRRGAGAGDGPASASSLMPHTSEVLGLRIPRIQGLGAVTGEGPFVTLMRRPGMLFVRALRSPYPRARVLRVDAARAEAMPGVARVLHRFNLPAEYRETVIDPGPPPRHLFNEEIVQVGMPVAFVAAESEHAADDAIDLIEVEYEVLEPVLDFRRAADPRTPKQWDNPLPGTVRAAFKPVVVGEPDEAFRRSDVVVEQVTTTPYQHHVPIELRAGIYEWEGDTLVTWQTSHEPFVVRRRLAAWLRMPEERIRVVQTGFMGASFGSSDHIVEELVLPAIMAKVTGRPVRSMQTREENFLVSSHRGRTRTAVRLGASRDGRLRAVEVDVLFDCGANVGATDAGGTPGVRGGWYVFQILYGFPHQKYAGTEVFTNNFRSGSMRGVGRYYGLLALETAVEKAAYATGIDPLELRLGNLNEKGAAFDEVTGEQPGLPFARPGGQRQALLRAAALIGWREKWHPSGARQVRPGVFHGMAIVCTVDRGGGTTGGSAGKMPLPSTGEVVLHPTGTLEVFSGSADQGAGQRTLMAMIAAQTCGIPLDQVVIAPGVDTAVNRDTGPTLSSLQTNLGGWGVLKAGLDAKRQLVARAAPLFAAARGGAVAPEALDVRDGFVVLAGDPSTRRPVRDVVASGGGPIRGYGEHRTVLTSERVATGAHAAEIEVDTTTGTITVVRYVAVHDVGRVLNRLALEQQVEGGVVLGLGAALWEELLRDEVTGLPLNPNMLDYLTPTTLDLPRVEVDFVEMPQEFGPYGALPIGQAATPPTGPVIVNALYNAVGVWVHDLPVSRARVLAAVGRTAGR